MLLVGQLGTTLALLLIGIFSLALLRGTDLLVANLRLHDIEPSALPRDVETKVLERQPGIDVGDHFIGLVTEGIDLLVVGVKRRTPVGKAMLGMACHNTSCCTPKCPSSP